MLRLDKISNIQRVSQTLQAINFEEMLNSKLFLFLMLLLNLFKSSGDEVDAIMRDFPKDRFRQNGV